MMASTSADLLYGALCAQHAGFPVGAMVLGEQAERVRVRPLMDETGAKPCGEPCCRHLCLSKCELNRHQRRTR